MRRISSRGGSRRSGKANGAVAPAELATFLEASVLYPPSVAELHEVHAEDVERRRLLVISVLLGEAVVKKAVEPILGRSAPYWGRAIVNSIPMSSIIRATEPSAGS